MLHNLIVFDLDGVITSEEAYWDTAGLVLHELLYSPRYWHIERSFSTYQPPSTFEESRRISDATLPKSVMIDLKARSVNSNWDTCFCAVCIYLIELLAQMPDRAQLLPLLPAEEAWIARFRKSLDGMSVPPQGDRNVFRRFNEPVFEGHVGLNFIAQLRVYASYRVGADVGGAFEYQGPFWRFCRDLFQEWYLGEVLYTRVYQRAPAQVGKHGCIHFEQPLLPVERMRHALEQLRTRGYTLGIATGRPRQEALVPLESYGLLDLFDEQHIVTANEVARAEAAMREQGQPTSLVKPHLYSFLRAALPTYQPGQPAPPRGSFLVVGDSTSDVRGGHAAGALVVAVLTGAQTPEARALLEQSRPDFLIEDMTRVPALLDHIESLATIQRLQFTERERAELLLRRWFARHMALNVEGVTLTPRAVSLNSFNGIYRANGEEYFFKTHVEEQGVLEEYYNAELLYQAGYNVVRPLRTLREQGRQMVIYPVIHWPVMFDLARAVETGESAMHAESLVDAESRECVRLLDIYRSSLAASTAEEHAHAPVHQLFWHRLTGGRLDSFYVGKRVPLPTEDTQAQKDAILFEDLLSCRWTINGTSYHYTLGELIEQAKHVLNPKRAAMTVIGHGDAHFGNVFLEEQERYLYFDPAFAGRHSPLLDVVKPLFHNIFATWMYFPREVAQEIQLTLSKEGTNLSLSHSYVPSPLRLALLDVKRDHLLKPLVALLREHDALPADWHALLRLALLCCPLLTINLLDATRVPPVICWLGLAYAVEMGHFDLVQ